MSKLIFKLSFKHPNLKSTTSKNVAHLNYIATRSGVDKTITEKDLTNELNKEINSEYSENRVYANYINERPKSHGLFGQYGIEDISNIKSELSKHDSFVWRGIVSLREDEAREIDYLNKEKWQDMLRKKMYDVGEQMDIPIDNLRWVAALHLEKGHPHVHLMIWEKEPKKPYGIISNKKLVNIRKELADEIFEEERFKQMLEKNSMRDLIYDEARQLVGDKSIELKNKKIEYELNEELKEMRILNVEFENNTSPPKLHTEEEDQLKLMMEELRVIMPNKGRISLKFMPPEVKDKVGLISDYILEQPTFKALLERNLISTENLTKIYTGKKEDIEKSRENTYKDIRDRVSQVVLRGVAESQKENIFYVDNELSAKALHFIKNMSNQINTYAEKREVLSQICITLYKANYDESEIIEKIKKLNDRESLNLSEDQIKDILTNAVNVDIKSNINYILSSKEVDKLSASINMITNDETVIMNKLKAINSNNTDALMKDVEELVSEGYLTKDFKLTDKGSTEILRIKKLDKAENAIINFLNKNKEENLYIDNLLKDKEITNSLFNKDPDEFKAIKFDVRLMDTYFPDLDNKITLDDIKDIIDLKHNGNIDKAESEYNYTKDRLEKWMLNGYLKYDKIEKTFQLTPTGISKISEVTNKFEFTRYDANVNLKYVEDAENGLDLISLEKRLYEETPNSKIVGLNESILYLTQKENIHLSKDYLNINKDGNITASEQGKLMSKEINDLNKYLIKNKNMINENDVNNKDVLSMVNNGIEKGYIYQNIKNGKLYIDNNFKNMNSFIYYIYKNGGAINQNNIIEVLEKYIKNDDAEKQFEYLKKRITTLCDEGYLYKNNDKYYVSEQGKQEKNNILFPEKKLLDKTLKYLEQLHLITMSDTGYKVTDTYIKYSKDNALQNNNVPISKICKNMYDIIDKTQNNLDLGKIQRNNNKIINGKYYKDELLINENEISYSNLRSKLNVKDIEEKTLQQLSTLILMSGENKESLSRILYTWNIKSGSNIDKEKIDKCIDLSFNKIKDNNYYQKTTLLSPKEWKELFKSLNIKDEDMPKWMYKGENWEDFNNKYSGNILNNLWRGIWNELKRQEAQKENYVEFMRMKQSKDHSKAAKKENIRKNKGSSLYNKEELER